ncbi:MAG: hypothetical protein P4L92_06440 [Rudaea sp.]|nr:hypothetical protein [Rudaea sp.]
MTTRSLFILFVAITVFGAGCSGGTAPPSSIDVAAAAKSALDAKADNELKLYEQMRSGGSWDLAISLGDELLKKYPGTAAAAQVQKTIADVRAKAASQLEARRLARLWAYNAVSEGNGTQYTAALASRQPLKAADAKKAARVRLILRQHPQWGQSVYLLLDNATFDCRNGCATLSVRFDEAKAERMKATIPPGGEPALFIDDDRGFIAKMQDAKAVSIDVTVKGVGDETVEFEVGGYDASKLPNKPKK